MSELTCDECSETITVAQKERRELKAVCDCAERNVRVSKATPLEWSA